MVLRPSPRTPHPLPRAASNVYHETDTLTKFEVMDGAPVRGESVPIRLYLAGFDLTPTYRNINMFTVRYYLNLVIVDEEERRCGVGMRLCGSRCRCCR